MKTVLHLTSGDESDFRHVMRSASLLRQHAELPHEDVTLLLHRWGVPLVAPDSPLADDVAAVIEQGVTVKAGATCFDAADLPHETIPWVEIVASGVSEVVRLQSEGYNYVKIP